MRTKRRIFKTGITSQDFLDLTDFSIAVGRKLTICYLGVNDNKGWTLQEFADLITENREEVEKHKDDEPPVENIKNAEKQEESKNEPPKPETC